MIDLILLAASVCIAETPVNTAGSVVQSKEWVIRRGKKREEEFIGDVRYNAAGISLSSDWALYRQEQNDWQARGHINAKKVFSNGDQLSTYGETAMYDQTSGSGHLEPESGKRLLIHRTSSIGDDYAEGQHLYWEGKTTATLSGLVRGWGAQGEFWASQVQISSTNVTKMYLTKQRPIIHSRYGLANIAMRAETITLQQNPRQSSASGNVLGWILEQSTAPALVKNFICGQLLEGKILNPFPQLTFSQFTVDQISDQQFWDQENIALQSKECSWTSQMEFWSQHANYQEFPILRLDLEGHRPILQFKNSSLSTALIGDRITGYILSKNTVAEGNVHGWIVFNDEDKLKKKKK